MNITPNEQTSVLAPMQQALATLSAQPTVSSLGMLDRIPTTSTTATNNNTNTITQIHGLNLQLPLLNGTTTDPQQFQNPLSIQTPNHISDETVAQIVTNNSVPEFLYQLTKMLTDDHRDVIEWSNGKIEVHNPHKLESDILNKYFRHSKYASFQRQLNYFGFRKLAGKGKMAPCSYVNENATADLRSLLRMKRKTSATTKDAKGDKGAASTENGINSNHKRISSQQSRGVIVNPVINILDNKRSKGANGLKIPISKGGVKHSFNGYLKSTPMNIPSNNLSINNPLASPPTTTQLSGGSLDPLTLAQSAVGKGVQHQFLMSSGPASHPGESLNKSTEPNKDTFTFLEPSQLGMGIEKSLSELQNNFRNSLNEHGQSTDDLSKLKRVSSLVDLAMIPSLNSIEPTPVYQMTTTSENLMSFVDFPTGEFDPKQCGDLPARLTG